MVGAPGRGALAKATAVALIVTAPSLAAFGAAWLLLGDAVQAALVGAAVHFAAMIFSFRIARRLFGGGAPGRAIK